jgi:hypothetical protein
MNEDKPAAGWSEAAYSQLLALRQNVAECIRDMRLHAGKQDLDQPRGHAVAKNLIFAADRLDGALLGAIPDAAVPADDGNPWDGAMLLREWLGILRALKDDDHGIAQAPTAKQQLIVLLEELAMHRRVAQRGQDTKPDAPIADDVTLTAQNSDEAGSPLPFPELKMPPPPDVTLAATQVGEAYGETPSAAAISRAVAAVREKLEAELHTERQLRVEAEGARAALLEAMSVMGRE